MFTVKMWAVLLGFSCPTQTLLLLAPILLGLQEVTHSELFGTNGVNAQLMCILSCQFSSWSQCAFSVCIDLLEYNRHIAPSHSFCIQKMPKAQTFTRLILKSHKKHSTLRFQFHSSWRFHTEILFLNSIDYILILFEDIKPTGLHMDPAKCLPHRLSLLWC